MSKRFLRRVIGVVFITLWVSGVAHAHMQWLRPSEFNVALNGGSVWIDVDMSVAERVFDIERPLEAGSISITQPDGNRTRQDRIFTNHVRTNFELELQSAGTYKIDVLNGPIVRQRPAPKPTPVMSNAPANRPVTKMVSRLVAYVTADAPNNKAISTTNEWLELVPLSHPADMVAGEPIRFKLLFNGNPVLDSAVVLMPAGSRYSDKSPDHAYRTDQHGEVEIVAGLAGVYALKADMTKALENDPEAEQLRAMSYLIFEAQVN